MHPCEHHYLLPTPLLSLSTFPRASPIIRTFTPMSCHCAHTGQSVIFLETAMTTGSRKRHATIEAVPVPREAGLDAPLYFKQGLLEADEQ
eukprot:18539-Eustigmatos_ZCMA.PRE.1